MRYLILILLVLNLPVYARAQSVWLDIEGATAFEEEFIRKDLAKKFRRIVNLRRDSNFGFDRGVDFDGGIKIRFTDTPGCLLATRKKQVFNIDLEQIVIQDVEIARDCIDLFDEQNRYYAYVNSVTHETACHALTGNKDHTEWGLCTPSLDTNKVKWGKRHRKYLRRNLVIPGRTGKYLMI